MSAKARPEQRQRAGKRSLFARDGGHGGAKGGKAEKGGVRACKGAQNEPGKRPQSTAPVIPDNSEARTPAKAYLGARWAINDLMESAAGGDIEATRYLRALAVEMTRGLYSLCAEHREAVELIKHEEPGAPWPLLHTDLETNEEGYLTVPPGHLLRLFGVIRTGQRFDVRAPGTKAALELYRVMQSYRRGPDKLTTKREREMKALQPLSLETLPEWWKLAKPFIEEWWGPEFQDHADFAGWLTERAPRSDNTLREKLPRGVRRSWITSGIRQGLESLASALRSDAPVDLT